MTTLNPRRTSLLLLLLFAALNLTACGQDTQSAKEDTSTTNQRKMNIQVNGHTLTATLVDNSSTTALLELLKKAPLSYEAHDYGNFEKVGDIGVTLPQNDTNITTEPGDIILYQGRNICIYYDRNTWNFTRLGKIDNVTQQDLKRILGSGNCTITLSLPQTSDIKTVVGKTNDKRGIYDTRGQKLDRRLDKGIYIEGGKKFLKSGF